MHLHSFANYNNSSIQVIHNSYFTESCKKIGLQEDLDDLKDLPNELECNFGALAEITYKFLSEDKFVFRQSDLAQTGWQELNYRKLA